MDRKRLAPSACRNMDEVREGVDAVDAAIVGLLAERFRYMDAAARIKPARSAVRDETRKARVIDHVRSLAAAEGVPADLAARLYEDLIEASIAYEFERFDALRA